MTTNKIIQNSTQKELIWELLTFKNWADDIFLDYIENLSEDQFSTPVSELNTSFKQILFHIYHTYWGEYQLLTDRDWSGEPDFDQMDQLKLISGIRHMNTKIINLLETHNLDETISYEEEGYEKPIKTNALIILLNFVEHSSYHRGQLALLLKFHGIETIKETNFHPYIMELKQ